MKQLLDQFFFPKSVAVLGATDKKEKVGYALLQNLLDFGGKVYPVNPKYSEVQGLPCFKRLKDLPERPDLVVVAIPAAQVPALMREFGAAGVQAVLIVSAGFRESGEAGAQLYHTLQKEAAAHGIRLIGPNCLGLLTPSIRLNATFSPSMPAQGRVAFITQSGALGSSILDWAIEKNVGFSHFVSVGNMADIGFEHLIDYFGADSRTSCILIYMEHLTNARKFMSAARAFARSKPIVILKAGSSPDGARAALMHTGASTGNDAVFDAAFHRAGVIRVQTIQQLFDCAQALAMQPLPSGDRLAIVTNGGGPAILALDVLAQRGGHLAVLSPKTLEKLEAILPPFRLNWENPVDVLGDCSVENYRASLRACLFDPGVSAVLAILTAQSMTDAAAVAEAVVAEAKQVYNKPVYTAWMGLRSVRSGREILESGKIPWYPFPERAVTVFMHMVRYRENLDLLYETPPDLPISLGGLQREAARQLLQQIRAAGRTVLSSEEAMAVLACYGIPGAEELETQNSKLKTPEPEERPLPAIFMGADKDPVFGPVISFGMGGPDAAIWADRAFGLPPLNLALAQQLMDHTKLARLLRENAVYAPPPEYLPLQLCRLAYFVMDFPDVKSAAIQMLGTPQTASRVVEATMVLEENPVSHRLPYEHLCILPYPTQWMKNAVLKDGLAVLLRPIRPEDEPLEAAMVQETSRESLYFRFFGYTPGIDHRMLARFTHIDYDREMAIVAQIEVDGKPKLIGVVRIVGDGWRETAEYAILVADAWHGRGLGGLLTDYIIEIARVQGYKKITASFLKRNGSMRRLFERKGFRIWGGSDESDYSELIL